MFGDVLEDLDEAERAAVAALLEAGSTDLDRRVCRNIAAETALSRGDFLAILRRFAALGASRTPAEAWRTACREHKFRGRPLGPEDCPGVLGRAMSLENLASLINEASPLEFTRGELERLLYRLSGSTGIDEVGEFETILREARLGRYLIWATFDPDERQSNPFQRLPQNRRAICTALGLGRFDRDESLVALAWDHRAVGSPPLHRPTIADAEDFEYFRPHPDPGASWGLTEPLTPNDDGVGPQPEIVMRVVKAEGLKLPILIF